MVIGPSQPVAFGPFVVDLRTGELRKGKTRVRLQDLPFRVLSILLEQPGEVVTRRHLQSRLWAQDGTFVDFDHSLNTAVAKLRAALADRASRPRYIETAGRRGYRFIGQIASAVAAAAPPESEPPSIAVLPLANLSADPQNDYFSDGLTEEFLNALAAIPGLRVVARTSSFQFKNAGEERDVREIGARLGVRFVLEGSVRSIAGRVRVAVQLIKVSDGYHVLSRMYDRTLHDIFDLQESLAREVAHELAPHLDQRSAAARGRTSAMTTRPPDAYSAYLQGRHHLMQNRVDGQTGAAAHFEQAIRLDPHFAAAHSGLAYALLGQVFFGIVDPAAAMQHARAAAEEALRLDPNLGEAHVSVALVEIGLEHAWESGARRLEYAARTLLPSNPFAAVVYGYWGLLLQGEPERSLELMDATLRLDPFNPQVHASKILNLGLLGRYAEAVDHYRTATNTGFVTDYFVHRTMAEIHHREGEHEKALETLLRSKADGVAMQEASHDVLGDFGFAYAITGRHREADEVAAIIERRAEKAGYVSPWNRALLWSGRGQASETLAALRQVVEEKSLKVGALAIDSRLGWLHGQPGFESLLREVGLKSVTSRS